MQSHAHMLLDMQGNTAALRERLRFIIVQGEIMHVAVHLMWLKTVSVGANGLLPACSSLSRAVANCMNGTRAGSCCKRNRTSDACVYAKCRSRSNVMYSFPKNDVKSSVVHIVSAGMRLDSVTTLQVWNASSGNAIRIAAAAWSDPLHTA
eukprot:3628446-Rhodomonas_salina.1